MKVLILEMVWGISEGDSLSLVKGVEEAINPTLIAIDKELDGVWLFCGGRIKFYMSHNGRQMFLLEFIKMSSRWMMRLSKVELLSSSEKALSFEEKQKGDQCSKLKFIHITSLMLMIAFEVLSALEFGDSSRFSPLKSVLNDWRRKVYLN